MAVCGTAFDMPTTDSIPFAAVFIVTPSTCTTPLCEVLAISRLLDVAFMKLLTDIVCVCADDAGLVRTTTLSVLARAAVIPNCDTLFASFDIY